jgi:hypothetical protein
MSDADRKFIDVTIFVLGVIFPYRKGGKSGLGIHASSLYIFHVHQEISACTEVALPTTEIRPCYCHIDHKGT